jgi:hypothetical protein
LKQGSTGLWESHIGDFSSKNGQGNWWLHKWGHYFFLKHPNWAFLMVSPAFLMVSPAFLMVSPWEIGKTLGEHRRWDPWDCRAAGDPAPSGSSWWLFYPSEKPWSSSVGMIIPNIWRKTHVPNHQPGSTWLCFSGFSPGTSRFISTKDIFSASNPLQRLRK